MSNINPLAILNNDPKYSIKNTITDTKTLYNIVNRNNNNISVFSNINNNSNNFDPTNNQQVNDAFNAVLQETAVKIACCNKSKPFNNNYNILVRKPATPGTNNIDGFVYQTMQVPVSLCNSELSPGSPTCDAFYDVYCANVINAFNKSNLPQSEKIRYIGDCACYDPSSPEQNSYPLTTPPKCYKENCATSYLDPVSRNERCSMTVCQNVLDLQNISGKTVNVNTTLQNQCGINPSNPTNTSNLIVPESESVLFNDNNTKIFVGIAIILLVIFCCCICFYK